MENIICDTNIWYDIAKGNIMPEKIANLKLIGTAVNIVEIASTPNLVKDIELVKRTIKALQNYHFKIISTNPFDHIISIFDSSFEPNDEQVKRLLNDFETLDNIPNLTELSSKELEVVKESVSKVVARKDYITGVVNDVLFQTQIFIKNNHLKKSYLSKSYKDSWKSFFIMLISEYYKEKYKKKFSIAENDIKWERLAFFMTAWDEYFKHLDIQYGRKFKNNDWYDLFNLVYVQPEFKYWTSEKRSWAKMLKENNYLKPHIYCYS